MMQTSDLNPPTTYQYGNSDPPSSQQPLPPPPNKLPASKANRSRKFYVLLSVFVCLIGCCFQIVYLNADFFQLKTISVREIETLAEEDLPGLTICQEKRQLLIAEAQEDCKILGEHKCVEKYFLNASIADQHLYTVSLPDFIRECWVPTKLNDRVECHRVLKLTPYITGTQKCFALHRPIDYQSLERIRYKRSRPLVISLNRTQFQQRRAWKVSIALHTLQHPLHYNDLIWLTLRPDRYTSNELTYNIEITQHLQFWIKHRCKNYTAEPFQSRANCYNVCFARHCRQINNAWPSQVPGFMDNFLNITDVDTDRRMTQSCERECGERDGHGDPLYECESYSFQCSVVNELLSDSDPQDQFTMRIFPPKYKVIYRSRFQTEFTHYFCFVASTLSLWLGLSIASVCARFLQMKLRKLHSLCS